MLHLTDTAICGILRELDIGTLLKIDRAFPEWKPVQVEVCSRRTLTLIIGNPELAFNLAMASTDSNLLLEKPQKILLQSDREAKRMMKRMMERTALQSYWIDKQTVEQWADRFLNVTSLAIIVRKEASSNAIDEVSRLLRRYSGNLTSFKFWCLYLDPLHMAHNCPLPAEQIVHLLEAINGLSQLKSLRLHLCNPVQMPDEFNFGRGLHLPILSCLTEFSFFSKDRARLIFDSLIRYAGPNSNLQKIEYGNPDLASDVPLLLTLEPTLAARFGHLSRAFSEQIELPLLKSFGQLFTSLTSLRIESVEDNWYCEIIYALAPLRSLIYLELSLRAHADPMDLIEPDCTARFPVLTSVSVLVLRIHAPSHDVLQPFRLGTVFPNLMRMHLELLRDDDAPGCMACDYNDYRNIPEEAFANCHTQVLTFLQRSCTSLREIHLPPFAKWSRIEESFSSPSF